MKIIPAPFPWFGGKSKVAKLVWPALGDVQHYVEPFFGSGAVLFARPHQPHTETINDLDYWVANFWRAAQRDPEAVAYYADNPVNEADLSARHIWLVKYGQPEIASRIPADPDYYDAKIAGWWVWGLCCWIGSGWCSGRGPWTEQEGVLVRGDAGRGINRQLLHLGDAGRGVNRKRPHLTNDGKGVNRPTNDDLIQYFQDISERLRMTRVCCGDWARIVTNGALSFGSSVGIFFDPPYSTGIRDKELYNTDNDHGDVASDVLRWCKDNGENPRYRIALCGYESEHNDLESMGWSKVAWKANRAYGNAKGKTDNSDNRMLERIWFSPACLENNNLFEEAEDV